MDFLFTEATRENALLRMAITGVTGGGKTYTAIGLATYLIGGTERDPSMKKHIAVIDSERGSAALYAKGRPWHFSHLRLERFEPETYVKAIKAAEEQGFEVIVIDSLSHEWAGTGGALEQVDKSAKGGNTFVAWGGVTKRHNAVIDAIMGSSVHVIATMRSKMAYEQSEKNGKKTVEKLGLAVVQRDGIEYEFSIVGDMDLNNTMTINKTRASVLQGRTYMQPGRELAGEIRAWLFDNDDVVGGIAPQAKGPRFVEPAPSAPVQPAKRESFDATVKDAAARLRAGTDADNLVIRMSNAPDNQALDALRAEIKAIADEHKPRVIAALMTRRIGLALTPAMLDEIESKINAAAVGAEACADLLALAKARRVDLDVAQAPAPVE